MLPASTDGHHAQSTHYKARLTTACVLGNWAVTFRVLSLYALPSEQITKLQQARSFQRSERRTEAAGTQGGIRYTYSASEKHSSLLRHHHFRIRGLPQPSDHLDLQYDTAAVLRRIGPHSRPRNSLNKRQTMTVRGKSDRFERTYSIVASRL